MSNNLTIEKLEKIARFESIASIDHSDSETFNFYRLIILSGLYRGKFVSFQLLKELTNISSAGNLSSHLRALEKQGLIKYHKGEAGRRVLSFYTLTDKGKKIYEKTVENLRDVLHGFKKDE